MVIIRLILLNFFFSFVLNDQRIYYIWAAIVILFLLLRKDSVKSEINEKTSHKRNVKSGFKNDGRKFILYLRGFSIDNKYPIDDITDIYLNTRHPHLYTNDRINSEEKIINMFSIGGPVVGIINPLENNYLGAWKFSPKEGKWQQAILSKIRRAKLVIVLPDFSKGILWELEQIIKLGLINKLVLILNFGIDNDLKIQQKRYNKFKDLVYNKFDLVIPEFSYNRKYLVFNELSIPSLLNSVEEVFENKSIPYENKVIYNLKNLYTENVYIKKEINENRLIGSLKFIFFSLLVFTITCLGLYSTINENNGYTLNLFILFNVSAILAYFISSLLTSLKMYLSNLIKFMYVLYFLIFAILLNSYSGNYFINYFYSNDNNLSEEFFMIFILIIALINSYFVLSIYSISKYEAHLKLE